MLGGCQCGAVRYTITGEPVAVIACHCTECQRQSGSAFGLTMIVRDEALKLEGTLKAFTREADSGRPITCYFCPECGTRIYHDPSSRPGTKNVKPGTLDDPSWLDPALHVWTRSKQPWVVIPEGVPTLEEQR